MCLPGVAAQLHREILDFISTSLAAEPDFASFAAIFRAPADAALDEEGFESALWAQLGALHDIDAPRFPWAPDYSADPAAADFAFSIGGHPFFIAGLHPSASRISRRFSHPVLVFNSHVQFERLRRDGRYYRLQREIRVREVRLQGSINPMLADHGEAGQAAQYSGRAVPADWVCSFGRSTSLDANAPDTKHSR